MTRISPRNPTPSIKIPAFPDAVTYRNWKIKVREAVVAASTKPDETFDWISEVWKKDQTLDALRKVAPFATLDAKLLSALTNIITGDFARKIDTFKETEAAANRMVRGRQVLFMMHDHFSTNMKHGATYALQDLFSVTLKGDNLRTFISNWDQVLAGITNVPDENVLETLFYNQVKNSRAIAHDMNEYHRAEEGTEKRSYEFLVSAIRRHLDRERLEANRDRVAKNLSGSARASAPAAEAKTGFIPKGYCVAWNKGSCTNDKCKFKHQVPPPRERSRQPKRDPSKERKRSQSPRGGKKECKFWRRGRCERGKDCKFSHDGPQGKARSATPARSPSKDKKDRKGSRSPGKRSRSRSSGKQSKSPKGSRSPKGGKATPAAVCLIASMLASTVESLAAPVIHACCPSVRFSSKIDTWKIKAVGFNDPLLTGKRNHGKVYESDHKFEVDHSAVEDAVLSATMLAGSVNNSLKGIEVRCKYECDTEFGCDHCIPKGLVAAPAPSREHVHGSIDLHLDWIADTGSAQDLVSTSELPDDFGYYSGSPIRMITANGESSSTKQGKVYVPKLGRVIDPYLVRSTPPVISVGMRCVDDKFDFIWRGSKGEEPYFIDNRGKKIGLTVHDYVPYLADKDDKTITAPAKRYARRKAVPNELEEDDYEPSILGEGEVIDLEANLGDFIPMTPPGMDGRDSVGDMVPRTPIASMDDDLVPECPPAEVQEEDDEFRLSDDEPVAEPPQLVGESAGSSSSVYDVDISAKRDMGERALRLEAQSRKHLLCHLPKNPYCRVCQNAKMLKPPSKKTEGSRQVDADKFGDHVTADFLVTASDQEVGIDEEKIALVVKDIATNFMYVYPNARRHANDTVLAIKHFTKTTDEIGVFYSDNAPELIKAMKVLQIRHVLSKQYISKSNAVAERAIRSVLEGTRVNLRQAGLHHLYWPHAARHWCLMQNVLTRDELESPWKQRFGEDFKGDLIPFGCQVEFWNGPRKKKDKESLKFDSTASDGIFLGYAIHPEFMFRNEFMIVPLKALKDAAFDEAVQPMRVIKLNKVEKFKFPMVGRALSIEGIEDWDDEDLEKSIQRSLEDQDAKPERKPEPSIADIERGDIQLPPSANAIYNPTWVSFLHHVDNQEGWYEFAGCHVNVKEFSENFIEPISKFEVADYPFRTTCNKIEGVWHVIEENLKVDNPASKLDAEIEVCEVLVTIFSKENIDLKARPDERPAPDEDGAGGELMEVINPVTGETENLDPKDSRYYNASGFKARRYKGSSKPMEIPPFVWQSMSIKARREAIREEQIKIARREEEKKAKSRAEAELINLEKHKPGVANIINQLEIQRDKHTGRSADDEPIPAMPICNFSPQRHRVKCIRVSIHEGDRVVNTLVARPVDKREIRANPKAQEALDIEWNKLVKKTAWMYDTVREWGEISGKAKKSGKKVHIGKVFEICVEKGSELPEGHKLRKFKGRTVFQGNNVRDENADVALFSELGSSPATMEAGKAVDAYGSQPGFTTEQNDGVQAYTQALMQGIETWVELPRDRWPKEWIGKYTRPAVLLRIALYGHPDSGGLWERHCEAMLAAVGFIMPDPEGWPSVFFHPELKLLMVVYVDDFKMSGPQESIAKGWQIISTKIDMDTPGSVNRYLGCDHVQQKNIKLTVHDHPFAHLFDKSLPDPAAKTAAAAHRTQDFWEIDHPNGVYIRHHCQPLKGYYVPDEDVINECELSNIRFTSVMSSPPEGVAAGEWDLYRDETGKSSNNRRLPNMWVGTTYLFSKKCTDPKRALASITRNKGEAKKKARAEGFSYMDQLFENQPCMTKPVTVMKYDMKPFLQSCVDRYVKLAGKDAKPLKHAATPFHEERIARPVASETESKGVLAPIATRVLMKILFAARMARFDLLRAVQGLAARVTKWSTDCDKALHRLVCYINSTLDITLNAFIGDPVSECRLWCFADSDHAGEYDNKSTTGCFLVLIGPNTYFPLTAFSKKQTSVSMSSTEAEVVAANISLRAVGLPSSGLWAYLQNAGGDPARNKKDKQSTPEGLPITSVKTEPEKDGDYWEFVRHRKFLVRVHNNSRAHLYDPSQSKTIPLSIKRIGYARTTIMITKDGVDFRQDSWKNKGDVAVEKQWTGKTFFRVYGPYEADYDIEAREVREALTDWEFIGHERMGEHLVSMIPSKSIQSVFVEDNQATIRIMESGRSPTFRHTDKTQRVNLSWLSEQFRRKWYGLIHGPTMMQAADILTKPFTNGEKWAFAVKLLAHCIGKPTIPSRPRPVHPPPCPARAEAVPSGLLRK